MTKGTTEVISWKTVSKYLLCVSLDNLYQKILDVALIMYDLNIATEGPEIKIMHQTLPNQILQMSD